LFSRLTVTFSLLTVITGLAFATELSSSFLIIPYATYLTFLFFPFQGPLLGHERPDSVHVCVGARDLAKLVPDAVVDANPFVVLYTFDPKANSFVFHSRSDMLVNARSPTVGRCYHFVTNV
jgi:hypothetical protein